MKLGDEPADAFNYLLISFFSVQSFPALSMSDSSPFTYIRHRPCMRGVRKADELLTFVVNSLIHANDNVRPCQARRGQLVAILHFSKFPDAMLREKPKCFGVSSPVSYPIHCCRGPA